MIGPSAHGMHYITLLTAGEQLLVAHFEKGGRKKMNVHGEFEHLRVLFPK